MKKNLSSILGCLLLILLISASLPVFGFWSSNRDHVSLPSNTFFDLNSYQHPMTPRVIDIKFPELNTKNYLLIDNDTNTVLAASNIYQHIYPASITKLATAITALNVYPLDELISIKNEYTEGKIMDLKTSENITVRSLVTALLVYSANDAAYNLAYHHQEGISGFVREMNLIAAKYKLHDTNFVNYDGIHNINHYSSAYDLSQLARVAIKNPVIREAVKYKKINITDITGQIIHPLVSTNELLGVVPEIEGLKTGWTPEAGGCFVSLINLNGHILIGVVAQSSDRFTDTVKIINWAKSAVIWAPYQL